MMNSTREDRKRDGNQYVRLATERAFEFRTNRRDSRRTEMTYDSNGNAIATITRQRFNDESSGSTGALFRRVT